MVIKKYSKYLVKNAKKLRNNMTDPEQILWNKLKKSSLNNLKFRRQQPIGPYIVDFVCCACKVIVELDGGQHNDEVNIDEDSIRDIFLEKMGYKVLRIWNNEIYNNFENVLNYIASNCAMNPTPKSKISTLPQGEGMHIKIQCPAKINLTLKIMNKREDGFHNIESIMQTINLYDYLTVSVKDSDKYNIELSGTSDEIPYNEKNLVYKAAMLFVERTNISPCAINIHIDKNIPVSAGLAGGSTDAAGTLYGLNKLFNEPLSKNELHELCAKLGSDLNFCLEGGCKMTKGRGEILEPCEFKEFDVSLIKPVNLGISAKEAYTKFSLNNNAGSLGRENYKNDLEWAVIDNYVELQHIKELYPETVMSGSGSVYFGVDMEFNPEEGYWIKNNLKTTPIGITEIK